ncbi:MAG: Gfo/Idh/MocA family oxidoreductase [Clostridia bacterium]|nr:Gfo/Idh/MocA family oxidoreductase [Clostridia bacterium]
MAEKLRIGVIGCGNMGRGVHIEAYKRMKNIEVVSVCDVLRDRAELASSMVGGNAQVFESYTDLINAGGIDAVDICTPNYLHSVIAVEALNAGLHVFCEKPDAVSVAEAEKMKAAAEASGKVLMVMRNNRYHGVSSYLKKYIEAGKMGEIYTARCGWIRRRGIPGKGGWFTTKAQSGGGPLIDLGVHMIDLTMWLMGNPKPVAVTGCTYSKFSGTNIEDSVHSKFGDKKEDGTFDVEDLAMGFIRFDNGATLQVECSWASNIEQSHRFFELRGTKGGTSWRNGEKLRINTEDDQGLLVIEPTVPGTRQIHEENLRHFADVLLNGAEPMFVPEQGLNMIKILEALYKSAECGHEIIL